MLHSCFRETPADEPSEFVVLTEDEQFAAVLRSVLVGPS